MPKTDIKVKSGKKYPVTYVVSGALSDLTREQVEMLAVRYLRSGARAFVLQKLNEAEPAIVVNQEMKARLIESGMATEETANAFFASMNKPLEIPTEFEIPITDLLPSESGRGKKAADIFAKEEVEDDDDDDETSEGNTSEA